MSTPTFFSFPYANYFSLDLPRALSFQKIGHSLGNNPMWLQPNKFCGMNHSTNFWRPYWHKNLIVDVFFPLFIHLKKILLLGTKKRWLKAWSFLLVKCQCLFSLHICSWVFLVAHTLRFYHFWLRNGFSLPSPTFSVIENCWASSAHVLS